jgi:hypothetical protein
MSPARSRWILDQRRNFSRRAQRIAQTDRQKQKREVSPLLAVQPLSQRPIDDRQLARSVVIEQVAGVRIAVKDGILRGRE